nr:fumarate reductase/succinate dehydrogenase flavoprotein subunit [Actinomycetota bacterium]
MMQCLADGYFILPHCVTDYLARLEQPHADPGHPAFAATEGEVADRLQSLLAVDGTTPVGVFHRELGNLMLDRCSIHRDPEGLRDAVGQIPGIRDRFWSDVKVDGSADSLNQSLEYAGRVADFLELGELMCRDALVREESCGCHLREDHQTEEGEAVRDDRRFSHVSVWEYAGPGEEPIEHREHLDFDVIEPVTRSYR